MLQQSSDTPIRHNQVPVSALQEVVNRYFALQGQPAPTIGSIAEFQALLPVMDSTTYANLATLALAQRQTVPVSIGSTSGTTGARKLVLTRTQTPGAKPSEADIQLVTELRMTGALQAGDVVANFFMVGLFSLLHHGFNRLLEACYCSVIPLASLCPDQAASQLRFLQQSGVNVLVGTPGTLIQIANTARQHQIDLPIQRILFTGERMGHAKAAVLKAAFPGVRIIGLYGLSETGFAAVELPNGAYKVRDLGYFVELDAEDRLLITCLDPSLPVPVVRYQTGDQMRLSEKAGLTLLHGIDRADQSFNYSGNLISLQTVRDLVQQASGLPDVTLELELTTDAQGWDWLHVQLLHDDPSLDVIAIRQQLLSHAELAEALHKQAGNIRVSCKPCHTASLSGRLKHRAIIDLR